MAVLAFVAFLTAGAAAQNRFRAPVTPGRFNADFQVVLFGRLYRLILPCMMLTVSIIWAPNCDYFRGLIFLPLFPGISVVLAVSLAYLLTSKAIRTRYLVLIGVLVCIVGPLFDIGFHPQFYTYNHVFGGVLGPIYDETLAIRPGLFWFRALTLLWAVLFYLAARKLRGFEPTMLRIALSAVAIGLVYLFSARLGFNTPEWYLQRQFSGLRQTAHFDIYFDSSETTTGEVDRWAVEHEYRYAVLERRLGVGVEDRIQSYVYPDESARARLTGARFTSVAPVWLRTPQVHVLAEQIGSVFPHELSHVFSREFGMPILRASPAVGLIEGLAVATEPPDGRPSPHEMVAASELFRSLEPAELAERVAATLTISGFWLGRGAVSYTVSGSFVGFLLDRYGTEAFKVAYQYGRFEKAYGKPVVDLALQWVRFLSQLPSIDRSAAWRADRTFSIPSLFEKGCPHWVPRAVTRANQAAELLEEGDAEAAFAEFERLLKADPDFRTARLGWARAALALGKEEIVVDKLNRYNRQDLTPAEMGILGDAMALVGQPDSAAALYQQALLLLPVYARETRALNALRRQTAIYPDIVRLLVSPDSAVALIERLESIIVERNIETAQAVAPGDLWRAHLYGEAEQYADALAVTEQVLSLSQGPCAPESSMDLRLRCPIWAAVYAYRAGDIEAALAYGEMAYLAHENAGDLAMARVLDDFLSKLSWYSNNFSLLSLLDATSAVIDERGFDYSMRARGKRASGI